jgi:hypothetical protein
MPGFRGLHPRFTINPDNPTILSVNTRYELWKIGYSMVLTNSEIANLAYRGFSYRLSPYPLKFETQIHSFFEKYQPGRSEMRDQKEFPIQPYHEPAVSWTDLKDKTLLVAGGFSDVMNLFYLPLMPELARKYKIKLLLVDLMDEAMAQEKLKQLIQRHGLKELSIQYMSKKTFDQQGLVPDGVLVTTWPNTHMDYIDWAMGQKIPVFVEKPLVLPEHIDAIKSKYASNSGLIFAVDYFFDNPIVLEAVKVINEGKIGGIRAITGKFLERGPIEPGRE